MKYIDLHVHSTESDGTYTPSQLVDYAIEKNLSAFALTDHDTTHGIAKALSAAKGKDIEVIPGIECSSSYNCRDVHIIGLCIDYKNTAFQKQIVLSRDSRDIRNKKMILLLQEKNLDITWEQMLEQFGEIVWTRAHFASLLFQKGYVTSVKEAFDRYLGDHAPCYIPREKITPEQTISSILNAGGVPILAHPLLYGLGRDALALLVKSFRAWGGIGIEAIYSTYTPNNENTVRQLASKYDLILSGGSDFHGLIKPNIDLGAGKGNLRIPRNILTTIKSHSPNYTGRP